MARRKKFKDSSLLGRALISLSTTGAWSVIKEEKLASFEREDIIFTLDGRSIPTFGPFEERAWRRGEPRPILDMETFTEGLDEVPEDVLVGLTLATLNSEKLHADDGYFFFNGEVAVALERSSIFIAPCPMPLLAARTQGSFAAVSRLAFAGPMMTIFAHRHALAVGDPLPNFDKLRVRFGYDDVEKNIVVDAAGTSPCIPTQAVVPLRFEGTDWLDFQQVLDVASIEPAAHARVSMAALTRAKRMSLPVTSDTKASDRAKKRDKSEHAPYTLLVSTPQGLAVAGSTHSFFIESKEEFEFALAKGSACDAGFCHVVNGKRLLSALLLDSTTTFGVGTSEKGKTCFIFETPSDGKLILAVSRFEATETSYVQGYSPRH